MSNETMISKTEAKEAIFKMAEEQGIQGSFKVSVKNHQTGGYNIINSADDLPEQISMGDVRVSAVLDQASSAWVVVTV